MGKGRTLKDLGSINQLFGKQEPEAGFAEQLAASEVAAAVEKFDEIEICILALMSNYRGWTVGDVQRNLAKHPDVGTIPALMNKFAHEGKFDIMQTTGRANTYTLKRKPVETITSARNKAPFKLVDPAGTRQAPDPKGVILVEEGLDVAIWKLMSDNKARTKNEICAMLSEYKFDRTLINRRVDAMINSRNYFDRRDGGHGGMRYSMKKHVPMPKPANATDDVAPVAQFRDNLSDAIAQKFAPTNTDISFSGHMGHSAEAMDRGVAAVEQAIKQERDEQKEDDAAHLAASAEPAPAVDPSLYVVHPDDSNAQVIWKVIHDHKWYTTPEIQTLVLAGKPDISAKSAATMLSKMFQDGLLERQPVEGKAYFNYRLKEGAPMPADNRLQHRVPKATQEAMKDAVASKAAEQQAELPMEAAPTAQQAPVQEPAAPVVTETQPTAEQEMTKASLVQVSPQPQAVAAPLLPLTTPIKGTDFTFDECRQLVDELRALGYGRDSGAVSSLTLVNQQVTIKGVVFEKDELDTITKTLIAQGFGTHHVSKR